MFDALLRRPSAHERGFAAPLAAAAAAARSQAPKSYSSAPKGVALDDSAEDSSTISNAVDRKGLNDPRPRSFEMHWRASRGMGDATSRPFNAVAFACPMRGEACATASRHFPSPKSGE